MNDFKLVEYEPSFFKNSHKSNGIWVVLAVVLLGFIITMYFIKYYNRLNIQSFQNSQYNDRNNVNQKEPESTEEIA